MTKAEVDNEKAQLDAHTINNDPKPINFASENLPEDLKSNGLFYLPVTNDNYGYATIINNQVKKRMEDYAFKYKEYPNTASLPSEWNKMGEHGYKYRLRLQKHPVIYEKTTTTRTENAGTTVETTDMQKDFFLIYLEDVTTGKYYSSGIEPGFINSVLKKFIEKSNL